MAVLQANALSKTASLRAYENGDLAILQQYLAQPDVSRLVEAFERVLHDGSACEDIQQGFRTMVAASSGLWFSGNPSDTGAAFRVALVNRQVEVHWFFSSEFARTTPTTLQVVFSRLARQAVARADWEIVETMLTSWVFCVAMALTTQAWILRTVYMEARTHDLLVDLLVANGAVEPLEDSA